MTDITLTEPSALTARADSARKAGAGDTRFRITAFAAAMMVLLIFMGVIFALVSGAMPAFKAFGFGFFTTEAWRPSREIFGALGPIYGTLVSSAIAMVIAVPVGIGVAIFLTELCPRVLRRPIGIASFKADLPLPFVHPRCSSHPPPHRKHAHGRGVCRV